MLSDVRARIERACERAGRDPLGVTLVAVTKGHTAAEIRQRILAHHHRILGENRVQEWRDKVEALGPGIAWHLIGHLQRNKVRFLDGVELIHSLDSERLADALELEGARRERTFRVLLQVNVAGEASKYGVPPSAAAALARHVEGLAHVELQGLMTMAPYADDAEASRPVFRALRRLGDTLGLPRLSMGMSGDFEVAVEEGATWVRIGSALFRQTATEGR